MPEKVHTVNIPAGEDPTPRPYHHGNLRAAIVEAGIATLAEGGELTVRDLARRVGVSPNAAYRHFTGKDALLAAIAAEGFRRFNADLAVAPSDDPRASLRAYGREYVRFARRHPSLFRLMFGPLLLANPSDELAEAGRAAFDVLLTNVGAAIGARPGDPRVPIGATFAWSVVHGLSFLELDGLLGNVAEPAGGVEQLIEGVLALATRLAPGGP